MTEEAISQRKHPNTTTSSQVLCNMPLTAGEDEDQAEDTFQARESIRHALGLVQRDVELLPPSKGRSCAITKLEEAAFWIAFALAEIK